MNCPHEVASILLRLLTLGILRIRSFAGDPDRCFAEADHLHNLPGLISHHSEAALLYYWRVERPSFRDQLADSDREVFEELWRELEPHLVTHELAKAH